MKKQEMISIIEQLEELFWDTSMEQQSDIRTNTDAIYHLIEDHKKLIKKVKIINLVLIIVILTNLLMVIL